MNQLIVTGSRKHNNLSRQFICDKLDEFHTKVGIDLLVQGGANGADTIAKQWAIGRGIQYAEFPALWNNHGKFAGHRRNESMIVNFPSAYVIGFPLPDSRGTWDCINRAKKLGRNVQVFSYE